jgi:hypothetical protein
MRVTLEAHCNNPSPWCQSNLNMSKYLSFLVKIGKQVPLHFINNVRIDATIEDNLIIFPFRYLEETAFASTTSPNEIIIPHRFSLILVIYSVLRLISEHFKVSFLISWCDFVMWVHLWYNNDDHS